MRQQLNGLLLLTVVLCFGCSVQEPGSPSWQVELTLPIADRVYPLQEIVADSTDSLGNWVSSAGNVPIYNFADSIETIYVDGNFQYDAFNEVVENYLGTRTVEPSAPQTTSFPIQELAPQLPPGETIPVAPFNFNPPPNQLDPFSEYDWAYLSWGDALVTVINNFPVPLEGLIIDVLSESPSESVAHVLVPGTLNPGQSSVNTVSLPTNEELDNVMSVQISGSSPGSQSSVYLSPEADIQVEVQLLEMGVYHARAHLEHQIFSEDSLYTLTETDTVINAIIKEGQVTYQIENVSELIDTVYFILPNFTLNDQPFTQVVVLYPHQTYESQPVDLVNYQFVRPQRDNKVEAQVLTALLDTADPAYNNPTPLIIFRPEDLVRTHYQVSTLYFTYFNGVLDTVDISIEQEPEALEGVPEGLESLDVESAIANLHLLNTIELPVEVYLKMDAYKHGVVGLTFNFPPILMPPAQNGVPGTLDQDVYGMESLVNLLPDSVRTYGNVNVSGETQVYDTDYLEGYFNLYSPFNFTMDSTSLEPVASTVDEGVDDQVSAVDLTLVLENHMPVFGEAMILASYDSSQFNLASNEVDTLLRAPLPHAELDENGYVVSPGDTTITRSLNAQQISLFVNANSQQPLYLQTFVILNSTEGDTVRCVTSDHITIGASAHVIVDVNTGN